MFEDRDDVLVERYRPKTLETYIGNPHIIEKVRLYIKNEDVPHLLLFGPAGTGKTTISKIIVNSLECDVLYINASDEAGVDTVRNKIKSFASTIGFSGLKIIILDEADYLTPNAQASLRNMMETFSKTTRFILTCNYIEKVISPIQSRCQTFQVFPPSKAEIAKHTAYVLKEEGIKFEIKDIATIVNTNYPDIRKILNTCDMQCVEGKLVLDQQAIVEANYMTKVLEVLKQKGNHRERILQIRQLIADSQVRTFETFYRFLFDSIDDFAKDNEASAILIIAEAQAHDAHVVDKEINAMSMIVKLVTEL